MLLGFWLFLATLLICLTAVFIVTRGSRFWPRFAIWFGIALYSIVSLGIGIVLATLLVKGLATAYEEAPMTIRQMARKPQATVPIAQPQVELTPQDEFWDISLRGTRSDIIFLKGEANNDTRLGLGYAEEYGGGYFVVAFEGDSIRLVAYYNSERSSARHILGVTHGAPVGVLLERLGPPSDTTVSEDLKRRAYSYRDLYVFFVMEKGKVFAFGIYNPDYGPVWPVFRQKGRENS